MASDLFPNGITVREHLKLTGSATLSLPSGVIIDDMVPAGAEYQASKLDHEHRPFYSQPNTTATAETRVMHAVKGDTGTLTKIECGSIVACTGNAEVTIDVKKNGTTVLSAPIVLDDTEVAYVPKEGTISVTALADDDVLTAHITIDDGGASGGDALATGVYVSISLDEKYA